MSRLPFQGSSFVADSSSLIYLAKSSLIEAFIRTFHVTIPPLVYQECVNNTYPGSDTIKALGQKGSLLIQPIRGNVELDFQVPRGGEGDVMILFYQLGPDAILIDDGEGVKACRSRGIPFVSAILIPSLLLTRSIIDMREAEESLERIVHVGRYSKPVILFARRVLKDVLKEKVQPPGTGFLSAE
jgi:hypothetical protein